MDGVTASEKCQDRIYIKVKDECHEAENLQQA